MKRLAYLLILFMALPPELLAETSLDARHPGSAGMSGLWDVIKTRVHAMFFTPQTWYVNHTGGFRYDAVDHPTGQCDGLSPNPYPGSGVNQHCAFFDVRSLWADGAFVTDPNAGYPKWGWVGAGGDTYLITDCIQYSAPAVPIPGSSGPCRVGFSGPNSGDSNLGVNGNPFASGAPSPPSGTAGAHTKILGANFASCGSQSAMAQLYGGYGVFQVLSLASAYVDVQCIELTRHSECIKYGSPAVPPGCSTSYPLDDYANNGIGTSTATANVLLQDMWIHGFTSRGIIGPIGGTVTATRVQIAINGETGWDFDDGTGNNIPGDPHQFGTPSVNGLLVATNLLVEWSGCNQAYPGGTVISCYSQSTGGQGDGIGTPAGTCISTTVTNSIFRYNTQDGYDWLHNDTGTCPSSVTNSMSYGNSGSQFKWGPANNPMVFTNNLALGNCYRLSVAFPGLPSSYNTNLADFCRAFDTIVGSLGPTGTALMANNTIISYSPTILDIEGGAAGSGGAVFTLENNIIMGYDNPATYCCGGAAGGPGMLVYTGYSGATVRSNNLYFGIGHSFSCPTGFASEICASPLLVGQPLFVNEASLDNFNFNITSGSPAKAAGMFISSIPTDYSGATRPNPPSDGALEPLGPVIVTYQFFGSGKHFGQQTIP